VETLEYEVDYIGGIERQHRGKIVCCKKGGAGRQACDAVVHVNMRVPVGLES